MNAFRDGDRAFEAQVAETNDPFNEEPSVFIFALFIVGPRRRSPNNAEEAAGGTERAQHDGAREHAGGLDLSLAVIVFVLSIEVPQQIQNLRWRSDNVVHVEIGTSRDFVN